MVVTGDGFEAIVRRIVESVPRDRRAFVAIDGIGGSGKSTWAARMMQCVESRPVVLVHADDFFHPPAVRHRRGRYSAEGFWLDAYDYPALVEGTLAPLREGRADSTGAEVPGDALLLVEGTFLHRDELVGLWDFSVYLDVSFAGAARRMSERGGVVPRGLLDRYEGAQRLYFASASPWARASLVVDNSDAERPVVVEPEAVRARVVTEDVPR